MPDFIAGTELWIETKAVQIYSAQNKETMQAPQDQGFILESFESILDQAEVQEKVRTMLHRVVYIPAFFALRHLCLHAGRSPEQTAKLQKQSSLGQHFLTHFLRSRVSSDDHGTFATSQSDSSIPPWKNLGQYQAHSALQYSGAVFSREAAAKTLVTSSAGVLGVAKDSSGSQVCFKRRQGRSDLEDLEDLEEDGEDFQRAMAPMASLLAPVFVDHDRSPHCERQALLGYLRMLQKHQAWQIEKVTDGM